VIEEAIAICHRWLDKWSDDNYHCPRKGLVSFQCNSILLGALTKELKRLKLLSPPPSVPFTGWSLSKLCSTLWMLRSPVWYEKEECLHATQHGCNFHVTLVPEIDALLTRTKGLALRDFKDCGDAAVEVLSGTAVTELRGTGFPHSFQYLA